MTQMHAIINKKEVTAGNRIKLNISGVPLKMSDLGSLAACTRGTSRTEDFKCREVRPSTAHFILRWPWCEVGSSWSLLLECNIISSFCFTKPFTCRNEIQVRA